ncbi:isocitrate lyase/PEP mutase family protein [Pseudoponticoccus marisrubri]|uniref:PEP phosphonomutase n=1 Tax=Pseudoponticoccus marisrubri TaxID=1685382 RepID=A0A0W7WN12_9RHOB|nr:isocitrate lyase/phosphoenolpyruvate mutase family protein [Pseudoponticoccus marisrubri]KUF11946.1 PEP phosphonomutase [Pseudoponticoccus marisrubri]
MNDTATRFRDLHRPGDPFILANAWDAGSARMLQALGAPAIGTSSAAHAFTLGRPDMGRVTRDEALAHAQDLVAAVTVPVSGDFENGFGAAPETCAETVRLAAEIGLAGISIEDTALPDATPYDAALAAERIRDAAAAARALKRDFVLVARADGVMNGQYDLDEGLARIASFEDAGADCLYIPMPPAFADLARICAATTLPVNALVAGPYTAHDRTAFARVGVARLSLGSSLARATHRVIHDAGKQMFGEGRFDLLSHSIGGDRIDALLGS